MSCLNLACNRKGFAKLRQAQNLQKQISHTTRPMANFHFLEVSNTEANLFWLKPKTYLAVINRNLP